MDFDAVDKILLEKMNELVKSAKSHYFSNEPSATKISIDELRRKLPIEGKDFDSLNTAVKNFKLFVNEPLIVKRRSLIRDPQSIKYYYDLAEEALKCNNQDSHLILKIVARCLILANSHHYITTCTQPDASASSFLGYILGIKNRHQECSYPLLFKFINDDSGLKNKIASLYVTPIREGFPKNRTLKNRQNNDSYEDIHIQELIKAKKLKVILVTIKEQKFNSRQDCTELFWPKPHEIITSNCIVIDKLSKRILAISIANELYQSNPNILRDMRESLNKITPSQWSMAHRKDSQIPNQENGLSPIQTGSIQLGIFSTRYPYCRNAYSKGSHERKDVLHQLEQVTHLATSAFEKLLPKTYQSAMSATESLRSSIPFLSGPFASATINKKISMKPHRDENTHSFSCMTVYEIDKNKDPSTLTCFPEWVIEDNEGTQKMASFVVKAADLFIADFDYIHFIPKTSEEVQRYSLLMYTFDQIVVPPILECEDSDLEESDYVALSAGSSQAASNPHAAATAAASSVQGRMNPVPQPQVDPFPLARYLAAQAKADTTYAQSHIPMLKQNTSLPAIGKLHLGKNNQEKGRIKTVLFESILNELKSELLTLLETKVNNGEVKFSLHLLLTGLKMNNLKSEFNRSFSESYDLESLLSTNTPIDNNCHVEQILTHGIIRDKRDVDNYLCPLKEYPIVSFLKKIISKFVNTNHLKANHFIGHIFLKNNECQKADTDLENLSVPIDIEVDDDKSGSETTDLVSTQAPIQSPHNAAPESTALSLSSLMHSSLSFRLFNSEINGDSSNLNNKREVLLKRASNEDIKPAHANKNSRH